MSGEILFKVLSSKKSAISMARSGDNGGSITSSIMNFSVQFENAVLMCTKT